VCSHRYLGPQNFSFRLPVHLENETNIVRRFQVSLTAGTEKDKLAAGGVRRPAWVRNRHNTGARAPKFFAPTGAPACGSIGTEPTAQYRAETLAPKSWDGDLGLERMTERQELSFLDTAFDHYEASNSPESNLRLGRTVRRMQHERGPRLCILLKIGSLSHRTMVPMGNSTQSGLERCAPLP
jgi:hypothetical protein